MLGIAPRSVITLVAVLNLFAIFPMHVYTMVLISPCPDLQTLMVQVWYPMTVCTNSRAQKEIIAKVWWKYMYKYLVAHLVMVTLTVP